MLPLPPGRFSTNTLWPHSCDSLSAMNRPRMSIAPEGENAMTILTGRSGYFCAAAVAGASRTLAAISPAGSPMPPAPCPSLERALLAKFIPVGDLGGEMLGEPVG